MRANRGAIVGCASLAVSASLAVATVPAFAVGETAKAEMKLSSGAEAGTVTFIESAAGVLLKFDLKGLTPGPHAMSVRERGQCDGDFSSAGPIYNPLGAKHGYLNEEGPMAGDLVNVYAGADGRVVGEVLGSFLSLNMDAEEPLLDGDGASLVISEGPDDYRSEPNGKAGRAIACGMIVIPH